MYYFEVVGGGPVHQFYISWDTTTKLLYATTVQIDDTIKKSQLKQLLNLLK